MMPPLAIHRRSRCLVGVLCRACALRRGPLSAAPLASAARLFPHWRCRCALAHARAKTPAPKHPAGARKHAGQGRGPFTGPRGPNERRRGPAAPPLVGPERRRLRRAVDLDHRDSYPSSRRNHLRHGLLGPHLGHLQRRKDGLCGPAGHRRLCAPRRSLPCAAPGVWRSGAGAAGAPRQAARILPRGQGRLHLRVGRVFLRRGWPGAGAVVFLAPSPSS